MTDDLVCLIPAVGVAVGVGEGVGVGVGVGVGDGIGDGVALGLGSGLFFDQISRSPNSKHQNSPTEFLITSFNLEQVDPPSSSGVGVGFFTTIPLSQINFFPDLVHV